MGETEDITQRPAPDESAETAEQEGDMSLDPAAPDDAEGDEITEEGSTADEKVGVSGSFDAIAPATPHAETPTPGGAPEPELGPAVPWWPFLVYLGAWIVLSAVSAWQLLILPATQVAYESQVYGITVLGGLIMTVVGPFLLLAVWFAVWTGRSARNRAGLLTSSLLKGALVTLGGAMVWWMVLILVDYLRLGRPL